MREVSESALNTPIHSMSSIPSYIFYARIELSKCVGVLSTLLLTYLIRQKADSETNWWFSKPTYPVCLLKNNIWMDLKSLWLIHRKIMKWKFWILVQIFWTKLCRILICFRICLLPDERSERKCTQHADTFAELNPSFSENIVFQVRTTTNQLLRPRTSVTRGQKWPNSSKTKTRHASCIGF